MVEPVQMQLSHLNLEHAVKNVREATAQALQTGREGEAVAEAIHKDQTVQTFESSEEASGVRVRRDRNRGGDSEERQKKKKPGQEEDESSETQSKAAKDGVDFYA
jgi:hypothetical protein